MTSELNDAVIRYKNHKYRKRDRLSPYYETVIINGSSYVGWTRQLDKDLIILADAFIKESENELRRMEKSNESRTIR